MNKALFLQGSGIARCLSGDRVGFVWSKGCFRGVEVGGTGRQVSAKS